MWPFKKNLQYTHMTSWLQIFGVNICYKTFLVYNSHSFLVHPNDELKICKVGLPWWSSD